MEEKDITVQDFDEMVAYSNSEGEVKAAMLLHIKRFWSRGKIVDFCINLLGWETIDRWVNSKDAWRSHNWSERIWISEDMEGWECLDCHVKTMDWEDVNTKFCFTEI